MSTTALDRPQVISLPNGEKVTPMFSSEEMDRRLARLRVLMAELDLEAVLFTQYHNINYYADFLYCSFGRKYGLVVTPKKVDLDLGQHRRWSAVASHGGRLQRGLHRLAARQLFPRRAGRDRNRGRVGIEFDHVRWRCRAKLEAVRCPSVELVDIGARTMRLPDDQVGRRNRGDHAWRERVMSAAPRLRRRARRRAGTRSGARVDPGDGARDRPPLPRFRADGYVDVVPVGDQYGRRSQSGHHAQGRKRATS